DAGAQPLRKGVRLPKRFDLPQQGGADGFFLFQKIKHVLILPVPKRERAGKTRRRIFPALRRSPAASIAQLPKNEKDFSVPQKRHALGGTHFCAQPRDRNSFPLISPWGQNLPLNHALAAKRLAHSQRQIALYVSHPSAHAGWTGRLDHSRISAHLRSHSITGRCWGQAPSHWPQPMQ